MVSLKDIAKKCGVSIATVSKALNDHHDISDATKERLVRAAREMGYFPNSQARALKTNRTYNIGVMFSEEEGKGLSQEFFARIISYFKDYCDNLGYDLTFVSSGFGKQKMSLYEHCKYRNVDGILLTSGDFTSPDVFEVINGDIPVVTIDYIFESATTVMSSNEMGVEKLVDHVIKNGHTKIAYIQGLYTSVTKRRLQGFFKGCQKHGVEINPDWIYKADYHNLEKAYIVTKQIMEKDEKPTCIFMPDDYSALGGMRALTDMGYKIPEDVSVVGFDGISYSQLMNPRLTTYAQDTKTIGRLAAEKLINMIEQPETSFTEEIVVEGELYEGETVKDLTK